MALLGKVGKETVKVLEKTKLVAMAMDALDLSGEKFEQTAERAREFPSSMIVRSRFRLGIVNDDKFDYDCYSKDGKRLFRAKGGRLLEKEHAEILDKKGGEAGRVYLTSNEEPKLFYLDREGGPRAELLYDEANCSESVLHMPCLMDWVDWRVEIKDRGFSRCVGIRDGDTEVALIAIPSPLAYSDPRDQDVIIGGSSEAHALLGLLVFVALNGNMKR